MKKPLAHWGINAVKAIKTSEEQAVLEGWSALPRPALLRVMPATAEAEALWRALAAQSLPQVTQVLDLAVSEGFLVVLERWLTGQTLREKMSGGQVGPGSAAKALLAGIGICECLAALYRAHGLLHLDIKPENVMLDALDHAVLIDFGAGVADSALVNHLQRRQQYTPRYAALERWTAPNAIGPLTDLHSLSLTLREWLTHVGEAAYAPWCALAKWEKTMADAGRDGLGSGAYESFQALLFEQLATCCS